MCLANSKKFVKLSADATGSGTRMRCGRGVRDDGSAGSCCGRSTGRRDTAARATLTPLAERSPQRTPQHRAQPAALPHMYPRPLGLAGAPLAGYAAGRNETFFRNGSVSERRGRGVPAGDGDRGLIPTYHYTVHDVLFV